jgi:hypothetical protein
MCVWSGRSFLCWEVEGESPPSSLPVPSRDGLNLVEQVRKDPVFGSPPFLHEA